MSVYVVTWNLNKEGAAYNRARDALMERFKIFDRISDTGLESTMFIDPQPSWTAQNVYNHLFAVMDGNDRILISRLTNAPIDYYGYLHPNVIKWLDARVR